MTLTNLACVQYLSALLAFCVTVAANLRSAPFHAEGNYWLGHPKLRHGFMPWADPPGYEFFRNVRDYGAKGDGKTDDTVAINLAIYSTSRTNSTDSRCGWNTQCGSSSTLGALVYFPLGEYLVSAPIIQYYYTQFVGDALSPPTIKAASNFKSPALNALIDVNPYVPGESGPPPNYPGVQWYINQNIFFRQIRNLKLDLTEVPDSVNPMYGIHWQVSQATSLQNIEIIMKKGSKSHNGMFTENGSGGFISDVIMRFGNVGWVIGNQQFLGRALQFFDNMEAIKLIWDWGTVWKNIKVFGSFKAINAETYAPNGNQGIGCLSVIDSTFKNSHYGITVEPDTEIPNLVFENVASSDSPVLLQHLGRERIIVAAEEGSLTDGIVNDTTGTVFENAIQEVQLNNTTSPNLRDKSGKIFERSRPQYDSVSIDLIVNVVDEGVKNDAASGDQSRKINDILENHIGKVIFFPAGVYILEDTVFVPIGSRLVGEGWTQLMASGSKFSDEENPRTMLKIANPGDRGIVEWSDFLFTVRGNTASAVLVEWNIHESFQGSAGIWDCHFRVGGAKGSDLILEECPKSQTSIEDTCKAASLLLHITPSSSGYFENIWAWTADHDIDAKIDPKKDINTQDQMTNVFSARGILVESQGPTWMYATAAEHNALYNYNFHKAKNIYVALLQTETPYYQPGIPASAVFTPGRFPGDPDFSECKGRFHCESAWALRIAESSDIVIHGAGMYTFFDSYFECSAGNSKSHGICVERVFGIENSTRIKVFNVYTVGSKETISVK
ncbi:pectin lyase-like protein [Corynespora cassiicola Philippines]|uniref:Pectin lyase-like protein n=1 Tax=Corynespora cassiicola Philippines TaxID=1448308 RepID=A0A2T2N8S9_CORCC|nr:pectin lyase-like protein [Corynespora cassiicola Philippines]